MYVLIEKQSNQIVQVMERDFLENLQLSDLFPEADAQAHIAAWCEGDTIPQFFAVTEDHKLRELTLEEQYDQQLITLNPDEKIEANKIVKMSLEEQVQAGLITLQPEDKVENNTIVKKSPPELLKEGLLILDEPFEYIEDNQIKTRALQEIILQKNIRNRDQYLKVVQKLTKKINKEITKKYSAGLEAKIIKAYLKWLDEGKPDNDKREQDFNVMEVEIKKIKKKYQSLKEELKKIGATLQAQTEA